MLCREISARGAGRASQKTGRSDRASRRKVEFWRYGNRNAFTAFEAM